MTIIKIPKKPAVFIPIQLKIKVHTTLVQTYHQLKNTETYF